MSNEQKQAKLTICFEPDGKDIEINKGESLLDAAHRAEVNITSTCGGRGICKSCIIQYQSNNAPPASEQDQFFFSKSKLIKGWRRACQTVPMEQSNIKVPKRTGAKATRLFVSSEDIWVHPELIINCVDVALQKPSHEDNSSDWQRLLFAVNQKAMSCNSIDFQLLQTLPLLLRNYNWSMQVVVRETEIIALQALHSPILGLAIDLGTTNIAILLVDLSTGNTLSSKGADNPLGKYGADVISRLSHAKNKPETLLQMQQLLIAVINDSATELCGENGLNKSSIVDIVVAGNTVMQHLFLALSVDHLGLAPFTSVIVQMQEIKAREIGIEVAAGAKLHVMDSIAGFVGGDHTAMLLGIRADLEKRTVIALDIGTNTEISLIHQGQIFSLSSPSGPALEGGNITHGMRAAEGAIEKVQIAGDKVQLTTVGNKPAIGICGSGVLDIVAEFYQIGVINFRGFIDKNAPHVLQQGKEFSLLLNKDNLVFTQADIRNVQLAKAAIRAGIDLLLEQSGLLATDLDSVIIAGSFGAYIRIESAIKIGMLPDLSLHRFEQIGNAAAIGAKLALLAYPLRQKAKQLAVDSKHIEQAGSKRFMRRFMGQINFPKLTL